MSVKEIGVVYTNPAEVAAYRRSVEQIGTALQLRVTAYGPSNDLRQLAQSLSPQSPRVLIFLGGTPELYQFTQGVDKQASQRYVVAMSDVNLQTLSQLGVSRHASVIATQVVPMVSANQAITMAYRECLARLYDEAPSPQGLAGFIAARYTFETMQRLNGPPTRQSVMQAMQKRSSFDLGGFHIRVDASRSTGTYVTQTMLGTNGRVVG